MRQHGCSSAHTVFFQTKRIAQSFKRICVGIVSYISHHRYFHHVYSRHKMRAIVSWATQLQITGFLMAGKPGALCAEGSSECVKDFVERIRHLPWQKMQTRVSPFFDSSFPSCNHFACANTGSMWRSFLQHIFGHSASSRRSGRVLVLQSTS